MKLLSKTGTASVDEALVMLVEQCESALPGCIRAYVLVGSQVEGTAVASSDVDLIIFLRTPTRDEDGAVFTKIVTKIRQVSGLDIECATREDSALSRGTAAFERAGILLYGEDLLADAPSLPIGDIARRWTVGSIQLMKLLRGCEGPLRYPLELPDSKDECCGYRLRRKTEPSSKRLVNAIARMAGAIMAFEAGEEPSSKRDSIEGFRRTIGGRWADFAGEAYAQLNVEWQYALPASADDRQRLKALCSTFLGFENHFLERCRIWLGESRKADCPRGRAWAENCAKAIDFGN